MAEKKWILILSLTFIIAVSQVHHLYMGELTSIMLEKLQQWRKPFNNGGKNLAIGPNLTACHSSYGRPDLLVYCCPPGFQNPVPFTDFKFPDPSPVRVRRPAHLLNESFIAKYNKALSIMKSLPYDDPRSFHRQANLHCQFCTGAYEMLNSSGSELNIHRTWMFFPWHRMMIYFHERILGSLIGDDTFALPFWAWDIPDGMTIPDFYVDKSSPFFHSQRDFSHFPPRVADLDYSPDDNDPRFDRKEQTETNLAFMYNRMVSGAKKTELFMGCTYKAGDKNCDSPGTIESAPHNTLHTWIGSGLNPGREDMGKFYSAAKDPVFYAHHSNIDRLWEVWRDINDRKLDIDDSDWLNSFFLFYDENLNLVKIKVKDVLDITKLGYSYEEVDRPWLNFLSTVMESSAGLYAAAASLGIDFQLFCSYSSESTDEIILNCIDYAAKTTRGPYPKMPDSETLAESFLTKFPSVNPLTAHAILSSGGMLVEFLQWSHERRIQAVQNYCVPDESIALFSALCKYGEREDSKSVMTDCSSSVSSGRNSDKCHYNVGSQGKQGKRKNSSNKVSTRMDESQHFEPVSKDEILHPSGLSKQYDSWKSTGSEMFQDYKKLSSSLNDIFDQEQDFGFLPQFPGRYDSDIYEGPNMLKEAKKPKLDVPLKDNIWDYNLGENAGMLNSLDWQITNSFENKREELTSEVTDFADSPMSGEDFSCFGNSNPFSSLVSEIEEDSTSKSKIARRLSFTKDSHTVFPYVSEINIGSDMLSSVTCPRQGLVGTSPNSDASPSNQENSIRDVLAQRSAACKGSLLKNDVSNHSATSLSRAILSNQPQLDSPWTIEFLNRIREKSRLRQQNLPSDTSASPFGRSGNIAKVPIKHIFPFRRSAALPCLAFCPAYCIFEHASSSCHS